MRAGILRSVVRLIVGLLAPGLLAIPVYVATPQTVGAQTVLTCATLHLFNFDPVPSGTIAASRTASVSLNPGDTVSVSWGGLTAFFWSVDATPVPGATGPSGTASYLVSTAAVFTFFKSVTGGPGFVRFTCTPGGTGGGAAPGPAEQHSQQQQGSREPIRQGLVMDILIAVLSGSVSEKNFFEVIDIVTTPGNSFYFPPVAENNASLNAISHQLFYFGGNSASAAVPLTAPNADWNFSLLLDGAYIDGTFGAMNLRTVIGTATLLGTHRLDDKTVIAGGLKVGAAGTTGTNPTSTLNTSQFGADLAVLHMVSPNLFGGLYGGYEINLHQGTNAAAVVSNFHSHLIKAGANLEGRFEWDEYTFTPALNALLQYRHTPSYTDGTGAVIVAVNAVDFDVIAGITAERGFYFDEKGLLVTPFLGLDLRGTYSTLAATDPFRVQARAGVRLLWDGGLTASVQSDLSRGLNTTMVGLSATVSAPIH